MVGVLVGLTFAILAAVFFVAITDYDKKKHKIAKGVFATVCGATLLLSVTLFVITVMATDEVQTGKNNLVAIQSDSRIEGSATGALTFLVADIGEEDVYTFYYETSDGGYKKGTINSSNVTIHETDKEEPSIIEYKKGIKGIPLSSILNFKDETKSEVDYTKDYGEEYDVWYEIFVPEGTIVRNFSLE